MRKLIYKILKYLNYIFILALLLSYLSVYVSPEKIWILAFFGLSFPYLLLANALFTIFWIYKKKRFFILPLLVLFSGWSFISSFIQISLKGNNTEKNSLNASIDILSYNVRLFDLYHWSENDNSPEQIFDFINKVNPDIICFQEFFTRTTGALTEDSLINKLDEDYNIHIDYTIEKSNFNYGIATFSKYPIVNRGVIKFSNSSNSSIYTDVIIKSDTIRIFNNHLQSIRFNKNNYSFISHTKNVKDEERMKEILDISIRLKDAFIKRARQAETLSNHIQGSKYPVFVCGDLNDTPVSYTYQTIQKGLNDSFIEAGNGIGNTYKGKFPSFRIDFIFHSKEIDCYDFRTAKITFSDHYPVIGKYYLHQ